MKCIMVVGKSVFFFSLYPIAAWIEEYTTSILSLKFFAYFHDHNVIIGNSVNARSRSHSNKSGQLSSLIPGFLQNAPSLLMWNIKLFCMTCAISFTILRSFAFTLIIIFRQIASGRIYSNLNQWAILEAEILKNPIMIMSTTISFDRVEWPTGGRWS